MADLPDWYQNDGTSGSNNSAPATLPPPPKSPLPDWYSDGSTDLKASLAAGSGIEPDHAAQVLKLKDQTGLPTPIISRNIDDLQKQQNANTVQATDYSKQFPGVSQWIGEDPHHAAVAGQDLPVLGAIEKQFSYLTNQAERGGYDVEHSILGMKSFLGLATRDDEQRRELIEKRLAYDLNKEAPGPVSKVFGSAVEAAPQLAGVVGLAGLAAVGGGATAATAATAGAFGMMETGNAYLDYRKRKDDAGNPISENEARGWATVSGVLNGAAALVPVGKLMEQVPGLRMLAKDGVDEILGNPTARSAFKEYVKGIGESGLTMGGFSGFQSLVHSAAGELASMHGDGSLQNASPSAILERMFSKENLKAALDAAQSGGTTGLAFGGILGTAGLLHNYGRAQDAMNAQSTWKNIGNAVQSTNMFKIAPEQMEKVVERLHPDGEVFIPMENWQSYWQDKKVDPRAVYREVAGTTQGYDDAIRAGTDLRVPSSRYAVTIAPSEHNDYFSTVLRQDPLAMNADEAQKSIGIQNEVDAKKEASEKIAKAIAPTAAEEAPKTPPAVVSGRRISEDVTKQLQASGFDRDTAGTYAKVYETAFRTMGERAGVDPFDLYRRYGLQISKREEPVTGQAAQEQGYEQSPSEKELPVVDLETAKASEKPVALFAGNQDYGDGNVKPLYTVYQKGQALGMRRTLSADQLPPDVEIIGKEPRAADQTPAVSREALTTEAGRAPDASLQARPMLESTGQTLLAQEGTSRVNEEVQRKLFPGPKVPSLESITREPEYVKMTQKASEIAMRYATERGVEPNPDFVQGLWHELHDAFGEVRTAPAAERLDVMKRVLAKYPSIEQDFMTLRDKLWSDTTDPYFKSQILGKKVYEQPSESGAARGQIRFGPEGQFNIDLLKHADLSTFLHETGHFYLEVMKDLAGRDGTPQELKSDYQTLRDFAGVEAGKDFEREHHEKVARAFEAYLMEGKAPSAELRLPFARFRAWLLNIYRQITNLNVPLTQDVRGVFDRLLASRLEIVSAEQRQGMNPLFEDPRAVGMNDQQAERYSRAIEEAHGTAQDRLMRQVMDRKLKEKSSAWRDERADVRKQVEEEAAKRKEFIAQEVLRGSGDAVTSLGIKPFKLSRQAIEEDFPQISQQHEDYPNISVHDLKGMLTDKDGVHPDTAAQILGFNSGDHLLTELATAPRRDEFIEKETDQRMLERHPDIATSGNLPTEAMKEVHNERRAQLMRMELQHLASDDFANFKGMLRKITRRIPTVAEVREQAEDMVSRLKTSETTPSLYQRAEATSSHEAQEHFLRGDFEKAFEAKKQELLNHELFRAAQIAKDQTTKDLNFVSKFDSDGVRARLGKAGSDYLAQIDALRERFDFGKASQQELQDRKGLRDFVEAQKRAGYEPDIPEDLLNEAYKTSWKELTNEQLRGVVDSMRTIDHLAGLKTKLLSIQAGRDYDEVKTSVLGALRDNFKIDDAALARKIDLHPSLKEKIGGALANFGAWRTKMEFLFRHLDGGQYHGPIWETFFKPLNEAEDFKTAKLREAYESVRDIFKDYSKSERAKFNSRLTYVPEIKMNMNRMDMIMTVLHWGNEGNRAELMRGYNWTEAQVRAIWKHLEPRDFQAAQKIWDYIDSYWPAISEQERKLNGLVPEKIEGAPFDVKMNDGSKLEMKGGYFPLVYDKNISWRTAVLGEDAMVKDLFATQGGRAATKRGWTQERVGGGGQAPSLKMTTFVNHVADVIHDLAYRKPVIDLYKLINDDEIRNHVQAAAGKEMYDQLNPWLKRVAGDRPWNPLGPYGALMSLRSNITTATLGFKVTSALVHASSYGAATSELGLKYALTGLKDSADIRGVWKFVKEKSEFMRSRPENFDRDIRAAGRDMNIAGVSDSLLGELKAMSPIKQSSFWALMRGVDMGVAIPTWMGAYRKAMEGGVRNIEEGNESEAVDYADQLVRDTKGSGSAKDLAPMQTAAGEFGKLFTMFFTQLNVIDNQFMDAYRQSRAGFKSRTDLLKTAATTWFLPAAMVMLLRGRTPDDDEGWGKWLAKGTLAYPMETVPFLREALSYWQSGKVEASPVFDAMGTIFGTAKNIEQQVTGQKEEWTGKDTRDAMMSLGYTTGLPTLQATRSAQYLYDWSTGAQQPDSPMEGIWRTLVGAKANS